MADNDDFLKITDLRCQLKQTGIFMANAITVLGRSKHDNSVMRLFLDYRLRSRTSYYVRRGRRPSLRHVRSALKSYPLYSLPAPPTIKQRSNKLSSLIQGLATRFHFTYKSRFTLSIFIGCSKNHFFKTYY